MRNELESQLEINTTILGDELGMSKEVKIGPMESGNPMKKIGSTLKQSSAKQEHPI